MRLMRLAERPHDLKLTVPSVSRVRENRMHGLTGGSWKRHTDRTRATEMKDTRGNLAVTSGSETYRRCALPRQLSTLLPRRNRHKRPILAAPHKVNNLTMPPSTTPPTSGSVNG